MGTPIPPERKPDPVPAGDDCGICWGIGKPLGDGPPPSQVIATFEGVEKGQYWIPGNGEPLDGDYVLTQGENHPCWWVNYDVPGDIEWYQDLGYSILHSHNDQGVLCVVQWEVECTTLFIHTNDMKFKGGSVKIRLPGIEK